MLIKNVKLLIIPIITLLFISLTCIEPSGSSNTGKNPSDDPITGNDPSDDPKDDPNEDNEPAGDPNNILSLPPMKNQFSEYFDFGNIFNPNDISEGKVINKRLLRHYNVLTAENNMKPSYLSSGLKQYNFQTADNMVNAAIASGFKVVGHTLLWHSQIPGWQANLRTDDTPADTALEQMKTYITDVVTHFKGRIYKWDVLNEAFPDGGYTTWQSSMRTGSQGNPWFIKIGSNFVYEGFLAARLADPDAILYYNDYNLNMSGKAAMVRDMVRDVNQKYAQELSAIRASNPNINLSRTDKLIEGIGMQSHHNTGVTSSSIKNTIDLFRPLGVEISISELDVLGQTYQQFEPAGHGRNKQDLTTVTQTGLDNQARLYGEYFKLFLENRDIIKRVTFWGVSDNASWRSAALPLLFDPENMAKQAYFKVIEALEGFKAK